MVDNNTTKQIMALGLSEYEAKAYQCLLKIQPATAYEVSKNSGIPSSKIYEIISRLTEKKIFFQMDDTGKTKKYFATPPKEFVDSRRTFFDSTLKTLETALSSIEKEPDVSCIWNFDTEDFLIEKSIRMINESTETILLSTWENEMEAIKPALLEAEARNIQIAVVHYGETDADVGRIFRHPISDTIYAEKGGRGFTLVCDAATAIVATIGEETTEGAWSNSQGFITLAEDYIRHDIYIMKIVSRLNETLLEKFGENYSLLRDVFNDTDLEQP